MVFLTLLILMVLIFLCVWYLLPFGLRKLSERRLAHLCQSRKAIVLSYDDGPSRTLTPRLLDLFAEKGVHATFFVIGSNAENGPDIVRRAIGDGHEVASHTFHHHNAWKVWPPRAARDISAGISTVRALGGDAGLFRPPFGKQTLATLIGCALKLQRIGWWTIDSRDARSDLPRRTVDEVIGQIEEKGGGVVLAHDFERRAGTEEAVSHEDYVIALSRKVVEFAQANGYTVMRLGEVLRGANT